MKEKLHVILLLWLCIWMQAVPAFPHHHHDGMPCLAHDMEPARTAKSTHGCTAGCTAHFQLVMPTPASHACCRKDITRPSSLPGCTTENEAILSAPLTHRPDNIRKAAFCPSRPIGGKGLRAPPAA